MEDFGFLKSNFRKLMKDIKYGSSKDDIDYKKILERAISLEIYPTGHPSLNDWCSEMNKELSDDIKKPYCYTKQENLWSEEEKDKLKILKL